MALVLEIIFGEEERISIVLAVHSNKIIQREEKSAINDHPFFEVKVDLLAKWLFGDEQHLL